MEKPRCKYCGKIIYKWQVCVGDAHYNLRIDDVRGEWKDWYHDACVPKFAQPQEQRNGQPTPTNNRYATALDVWREWNKENKPFLTWCKKKKEEL